MAGSMIPPGWYEATKTTPKTTQPVPQQTAQPKQTTQTYNPATNTGAQTSDGKNAYMWHNGNIHTVTNSAVDKYLGLGYELDSGQLAAKERGTPMQGYGTLQGLPAGMSDDDYFRQYMGTTAADYYMSQASNPQQTQQNSFNAENDARIKALEQMLLDMQNKNNYNQSQNANANQNVTSGTPGQHIFTPQNEEVAPGTPGYTQSNNSMNDTLFKYLNNIWQGGM